MCKFICNRRQILKIEKPLEKTPAELPEVAARTSSSRTWLNIDPVRCNGTYLMTEPECHVAHTVGSLISLFDHLSEPSADMCPLDVLDRLIPMEQETGMAPPKPLNIPEVQPKLSHGTTQSLRLT